MELQGEEKPNDLRTGREKFHPCASLVDANSLPVKVLRLVFSRLSTKDKLSASLVCRRWLNALDDPGLMAGIQVQLGLEDFKHFIRRSRHERRFYFSRGFTSFKFTQINFNIVVLNFLEGYGEKIKVLWLDSCKMEDDLVRRFSGRHCCRNLEHLQFTNCAVGIFHKLPSLRMLVLQDVNEDANDYFRDLADILATPERPPMPFLLNFIRSHAETPMEVFISPGYGSGGKSLYNDVLQLDGLKLRNLMLDFLLLNDGSPSYVRDILQRFPTLTEVGIYVDSCDHLDAVCALLPNLRSLDIREGRSLINLTGVFRLKCLQTLSISARVQNDVFVEALPFFQMSGLVHLVLIDACIEPEPLRSLLGGMPGLHTLVMRDVGGVTNETLRFISETLVHLRSLHIRSHRLSDGALVDESSPRRSLSNLKGLRSLLLDCRSVTAAAAVEAVKFPRLHSLIWKRYTFIPENFEEEIRKANPSLHELEIY